MQVPSPLSFPVASIRFISTAWCNHPGWRFFSRPCRVLQGDTPPDAGAARDGVQKAAFEDECDGPQRGPGAHAPSSQSRTSGRLTAQCKDSARTWRPPLPGCAMAQRRGTRRCWRRCASAGLTARSHTSSRQGRCAPSTTFGEQQLVSHHLQQRKSLLRPG